MIRNYIVLSKNKKLPLNISTNPMQRNAHPSFSLTRKNSPHKNSATSCRNKLLSDRASYESARAESNLFVDIGLCDSLNQAKKLIWPT